MATMHTISWSKEEGLLRMDGSKVVRLMWVETEAMPLEIEKMGPNVKARIN